MAARRDVRAGSSRPEIAGRRFRRRLAAHAEFAAAGLERSRLEISDLMFKHQLRLADRQCRMAELSQRIQDRVVMLATSLWAGRQSNEIVQRCRRGPSAAT